MGELMGLRQAKVIAQVKESFLTLCQQYEAQGKQLEAMARVLVEDGMLNSKCGHVAAAQLAQYNEIGEQLKTLGTAIDLLGGRPVLQEGPIKVISGTRKELKERGIRVPKEG